MSKDLAGARSGFMVEFLVGFLFFPDSSSLGADFGLSIGAISRNTRGVFSNALVIVPGRQSWPDFSAFLVRMVV